MNSPSRSTFAIEADNLVKRFGDFTAVNGVSFAVPEGSVLGLLGPNGAGKTTIVRMLATLSPPTSGSARIAGYDVEREPDLVRRSMGLTGQAATVDEYLTGRENIRLIGGLYGIGRGDLARRSDELLEQFSLTDAGDKQARSYSGGMRRRLDLAVSLIAAPPVLFLDEPTTGLDPRSRNELWDVLRALVNDGTTLLLTTQYLEEADQLADDIVVIDKGEVIAHGTPLQLKEQAGAASLELTVTDADDIDAAAALLRKTGSEVFVDRNARRITTPAGGLGDLTRVAGWLDESNIAVDDLGLARPSLDDVFLALTGHRAEDENNTDTNESELAASGSGSGEKSR
ncbi:MAG: ATP-binding cassette domain-containing protein [Gordonia amarae]